jgi:hypothetical protein
MDARGNPLLRVCFCAFLYIACSYCDVLDLPIGRECMRLCAFFAECGTALFQVSKKLLRRNVGLCLGKCVYVCVCTCVHLLPQAYYKLQHTYTLGWTHTYRHACTYMHTYTYMQAVLRHNFLFPCIMNMIYINIYIHIYI